MSPAQLPQYVLAILPPMYVAFSRVLSRSKLSGGDLLTLFLLRSSQVTIDGRKVLLLGDLLDRLSTSLGYVQPAPASDLLGKLHNKGLITKMNVTDLQRETLFPKGKRNAAVFLNPEGDSEFQKFCKALDEATREFLDHLPEEVRDQFYLLFSAAETYESLVPVLQHAFLTGPDEEQRFMVASKTFLGESFEETVEISNLYRTHAALLPTDKLTSFIGEFERSVVGTPRGLQRRSGEDENSGINKLVEFLDQLVIKYR